MLAGDGWTATLNLANIAAPLKTCRIEKAEEPESFCRYFANAYVQKFGEDQGSSDAMRAPLGDMVQAGADPQALLQAAARSQQEKAGYVCDEVAECCGMDLSLDSGEALVGGFKQCCTAKSNDPEYQLAKRSEGGELLRLGATQ